MTALPRLYLSQTPELDRLTALELGRVDEGQPADAWRAVGDHVGILVDDGRDVGFCVLDVSAYDPDDEAHAALWDGPRFAVPALGLADAAPNEIIVATRALYGSRATVNRRLFSAAIDAQGPGALHRWLQCLQAGDSMAHYALGYTLFEMGRLREAYRHLRHYSEIAPRTAWAWAWRGRAAAALGHLEEARAAYALAIELEDEEGGPTDAAELLARLEDGDVELPGPVEEEDDWTAATLSLVDALGLRAHVMIGDEDALVLLDVDGTPAWLGLDRDVDEVTVRALVGSPAAALDAEGRLVDRLADPRDRLVEDGALWCALDAAGLLPDDPRVIAALVAGAAQRAMALRADLAVDGLLEPGPAFEDLVRELEDDSGDTPPA